MNSSTAPNANTAQATLPAVVGAASTWPARRGRPAARSPGAGGRAAAASPARRSARRCPGSRSWCSCFQDDPPGVTKRHHQTTIGPPPLFARNNCPVSPGDASCEPAEPPRRRRRRAAPRCGGRRRRGSLRARVRTGPRTAAAGPAAPRRAALAADQHPAVAPTEMPSPWRCVGQPHGAARLEARGTCRPWRCRSCAARTCRPSGKNAPSVTSPATRRTAAARSAVVRRAAGAARRRRCRRRRAWNHEEPAGPRVRPAASRRRADRRGRRGRSAAPAGPRRPGAAPGRPRRRRGARALSPMSPTHTVPSRPGASASTSIDLVGVRRPARPSRRWPGRRRRAPAPSPESLTVSTDRAGVDQPAGLVDRRVGEREQRRAVRRRSPSPRGGAAPTEAAQQPSASAAALRQPVTQQLRQRAGARPSVRVSSSSSSRAPSRRRRRRCAPRAAACCAGVCWLSTNSMTSTR